MNLVSRISSSVINFDVFNLPPYTQIGVVVNSIDHSLLVSPENKLIGDPLISDSTGRVKGKLLLNQWCASYVGDLQIAFKSTEQATDAYDPPIYALVTIPVDRSTQTTNTRLDDTLSAGNGNTVIPPAGTRGTQEASSALSPITQTFFVDASRYPQGLAVTSLELYFASKDSQLPVSVELRRVINGIPSAGEVIQGTLVVKNPADVNVPAAPNSGLGPSTKFSFAPIYLAPGEYAFSVLSNSSNYSLYAGKMGEAILGSTEIVNKEPYTGRLFKSQNTNLWLEENNTDLCFKLNKAKFETGTKSFELQSADIPVTEFDNIYLDTVQYNFGEQTNINYSVSGVRAIDGVVQNYTSIKEKTPFKLLHRWKTQATGDTKVNVTFTNNSKDISPALDKSRTALYSFKNLIDPFEIDTRNSEIQAANGVAKSKYISKIVTLEEGFDSTGLEVKLDVNRKTGTDIDVFCRVISSSDNALDASIEKRDWKLMPLYNQTASVSNPASISGNIGKSYAGLSDTVFYNETYKILEGDSLATTGTANLAYTATLGGVETTFTSFNKFQVKVVFYAADTTIVPKIKNLIATAVI